MNGRLEARRAIEALRAGVPSAAAVKALGGGQPRLEQRFRDLLASVEGLTADGRQAHGFFVRGGFGEGKSHLLTTFEHMALDAGFAVSRVVVSKETPLQDPARLLPAAVEAMRIPNAIGRGLDEVGVRLRHRFDAPEYVDLVRDLNLRGDLNSRFAATLFVFENGGADEEIIERMLRFWSGDKLNVSDLRRVLRELGQAASFPLETVKARDLALQTLRFLPRLCIAAGLRGWVLLIDEVELVGRYTRLQRARSYVELARWLGEIDDDSRRGLVAVAAITNDFEREVLIDKGDLDLIAPFLELRAPEQAEPAQAGMRLIRAADPLHPHDHEMLQATYRTLKDMHGTAYQWEPPDVAWPEALGSAAMRTFVRAWINAWDVRRLYPDFREGERPYELDEVRTEYGEQDALSDEDAGGAPADSW